MSRRENDFIIHGSVLGQRILANEGIEIFFQVGVAVAVQVFVRVTRVVRVQAVGLFPNLEILKALHDFLVGCQLK